MGNRAVIVLDAIPNIGVYVHWAGSPEDIDQFLAAAKSSGARSPGSDPNYALAALIHVVTTSVYEGQKGELLSVGVMDLIDQEADPGDNGVYVIGSNWEVIERR